MAEQDSVLGYLFEMQRMFFECVRGELGDHMDIHPRQGPVLGLLMRCDGLSQADIVRALHVSAATVAVSISRLERLGYVKRERNPNNHRANVISLTDEGRQNAKRLQQAILNVKNTALQGLTDEELQQLCLLCGKMSTNLQTRYLQGEEGTNPCDKC